MDIGFSSFRQPRRSTLCRGRCRHALSSEVASAAQSRAERKRGTPPVPPPGTQSVPAPPPFSAFQRRVWCAWGPRGWGSGRQTSTRGDGPGTRPPAPRPMAWRSSGSTRTVVGRFGWAGVWQGSVRVSGLAQTHTGLWPPLWAAFTSPGLRMLLPAHGLPRPRRRQRRRRSGFGDPTENTRRPHHKGEHFR